MKEITIYLGCHDFYVSVVTSIQMRRMIQEMTECENKTTLKIETNEHETFLLHYFYSF